jgi:hypothetical protein
VLQAVDNQSGQIARRGNDISQAGINRAAWHGIELGCGRILNERQATMVADRQQAERSIRAHAGKNDADGPFAPVFGQAGQK